jgi:hypothetical protein
LSGFILHWTSHLVPRSMSYCLTTLRNHTKNICNQCSLETVLDDADPSQSSDRRPLTSDLLDAQRPSARLRLFGHQSKDVPFRIAKLG